MKWMETNIINQWHTKVVEKHDEFRVEKKMSRKGREDDIATGISHGSSIYISKKIIYKMQYLTRNLHYIAVHETVNGISVWQYSHLWKLKE